MDVHKKFERQVAHSGWLSFSAALTATNEEDAKRLTKATAVALKKRNEAVAALKSAEAAYYAAFQSELGASVAFSSRHDSIEQAIRDIEGPAEPEVTARRAPRVSAAGVDPPGVPGRVGLLSQRAPRRLGGAAG